MRSVLPKYSSTLTLVVESPWKAEVFRVDRSIGEFFTADGEFVEGAMAECVRKTLLPAVKRVDA